MHGNSLLAVTPMPHASSSFKLHVFNVHFIIDQENLGMQLREVAWFSHLNGI